MGRMPWRRDCSRWGGRGGLLWMRFRRLASSLIDWVELYWWWLWYQLYSIKCSCVGSSDAIALDNGCTSLYLQRMLSRWPFVEGDGAGNNKRRMTEDDERRWRLRRQGVLRTTFISASDNPNIL
jgi:hypothetical protein